MISDDEKIIYDWRNRMEISFPGYTGSQTLTNFPMLREDFATKCSTNWMRSMRACKRY